MLQGIETVTFFFKQFAMRQLSQILMCQEVQKEHAENLAPQFSFHTSRCSLGAGVRLLDSKAFGSCLLLLLLRLSHYCHDAGLTSKQLLVATQMTTTTTMVSAKEAVVAACTPLQEAQHLIQPLSLLLHQHC